MFAIDKPVLEMDFRPEFSSPPALDYKKLTTCFSTAASRLLPKTTTSANGQPGYLMSMEEHRKLTEDSLERQATLDAAHKLAMEKQRSDFAKMTAEQASAAQQDRHRSQELGHRTSLAVISSHNLTVSAITNTNTTTKHAETDSKPKSRANELLYEVDPDLTIELLVANPDYIAEAMKGVLTLGGKVVVKSALKKEGVKFKPSSTGGGVEVYYHQ